MKVNGTAVTRLIKYEFTGDTTYQHITTLKFREVFAEHIHSPHHCIAPNSSSAAISTRSSSLSLRLSHSDSSST